MKITKSGYLYGIQCMKLLWSRVHARHLFPEPSSAEQTRFEQGQAVGALAREIHPNAANLAEIANTAEAVAATRQVLGQEIPIYEGAFQVGDLLIRSDVLEPTSNGAWNLIEVKSSTSVKDQHYADTAFQLHVLKAAGIQTDQVFLMHLNSDYRRQGDIDPRKLFEQSNITQEAHSLVNRIPQQLDSMREVLKRAESPETEIGPHCSAPYECPLKAVCWRHVPRHSVFNLYRGGKKGWELYEKKILSLGDIPSDSDLTEKQQIQKETEESQQPHVDREGLRSFLSQIEYPAYFVDFETFSSALPLISDSRPYQQIPFQFSLHIQHAADSGQLEHHSFLADGPGDPRPEFMECLIDLLGNHGSIITYNQGFELGRLRECAELLPQYGPAVEQIENRMMDLLDPFRAFQAYNPHQNGSCSIKAVLPSWTDLTYEGMEIGNGSDASLEYLRITFGEVDDSEKQVVRTALEQYCALDTLAMVRLVEALRRCI